MAGDGTSERAAESAVAAEAAQIAANAVANVASADAIAVDAIEHAEERIEAAERVVEQIADAAVQSELGRQVADATEKVGACLSRVEAMETSTAEALTGMAAQLAALSELVTGLTSAPPIVALLSPSSPPALDTTLTPNLPPEVTPAVVIVPGDVAALPAPVNAAPPRRTRRLI